MRIPLLLLVLICLAGGAAGAGDHAVVLMYHRFGEGDVPATSIRLSQFEDQLDHLERGGFTVWPLSRIVAAWQSGEPLPDRTVAITADDAYRSVMTEAWPRLEQRGWPLTLFVATDPIDKGKGRYLSWDEIRRLRDEGVEIGAHSASHGHLPFMTADALAGDLERSQQRFRAELGMVPRLFAYPFGERSEMVAEMVRRAGYVAAFGQHSGVADAAADRFELPRFAMNEHYGALDRFHAAVEARPLAVAESQPANNVVEAGTQPYFAFRLVTGRDGRLTCYHSAADDAVPLIWNGDRVGFRAPAPLPPGRSRFNCTLPGPDGRWSWYGRQFAAPGGPD